ncbi:MAG: hypothetical protein JF615_17655 [Asticcacaulis sp.]|nr:hypothetical protein [Asticcacaulis sp.]
MIAAVIATTVSVAAVITTIAAVPVAELLAVGDGALGLPQHGRVGFAAHGQGDQGSTDDGPDLLHDTVIGLRT